MTAFRSTSTGTGTASGTVTAALPAGVAEGDVVLAFIGQSQSSTTVTTPAAGWTELHAIAGADFSGFVYYRLYQSGDAAPSWILSSATGSWSLDLVAYAGVDTTTPISASAAVETGAAANTLAASVTPGVDDATLVLWEGIDAGAPARAWSQDGAMTERLERLDNGMHRFVADEELTGGSGVLATRSGTWDGTAQDGLGAIIALAPSAVPTAGTVNHLWVGAPTHDGFTVASRISGGTSVRLGVSLSSGMTSPTYVAAEAPSADGIVKHTVTGLAAETQYYFQLFDTPSGGSETATGPVGQAKTLPPSGGAQSFTFGAGSCMTTNAAETDALDDARAWGPDFFLLLGDFNYSDQASTDPADHVSEWASQIQGKAGLAQFVRELPSFYCTSDHEAADAGLQANIDAYQDVVPHLPLLDPSATKISRDQSWSVGRVGFYLIDVRNTDRSPGLNADDATKTMLGAAQKARLKAWLTDGVDDLKVIVGDVAWIGAATVTAGQEDKWWSYATERQELADYVTTNGVNAVYVHGDTHVLGVAEGADNPHGGFPVYCCAPLAQAGGGFNTAVFTSEWNTFPDRTSQYMRFTVDDDGSTITLTASGWDAVAGVERVAQVDTWAVSSGGGGGSPVTATEELPAALRRVSGTTLDAQGAANAWAGTTGLDLLAALNTKAGNARGSWVGLLDVLNQLAGTTGLDVNAAAAQLTDGVEQQGLMPSESLSPSETLEPQ